MPYFTHLRKKSSFAVVETNGKLYIDGQGYSPDTLKPILGAEFDVFSPTPNSASFFDFGSPVICLPRTSVICSAATLQSNGSGKNKAFDSTVLFSGQEYGAIGIAAIDSGYVLAQKSDPSGVSRATDKLRLLGQDLSLSSVSGEITVNEGAESASYRLATMFWNRASALDPVIGFNSRYLVNNTTTSSNLFSVPVDNLAGYAKQEPEKNNVQQLVFHDPTKAVSSNGLSLVGKMPINLSGLSQPAIYSVNPSSGARASVATDFPTESFWFRRGAVGFNPSAAIATDSSGRYVNLLTIASNDSKLSKYDAETGQHVLSKAATAQATADISRMVVDGSGNLYFIAHDTALQIYKYDSDLNLKWYLNFSIGSALYDNDIALDSDGTLYIASPTSYAEAGGSIRDGQLAAVNSSGSVIWLKKYGPRSTSSEDWFASVCVNGADTAYLYACGSISSGALQLAKLSKSDGTMAWRKSYSGLGRGSCIRSDSSGNLYVLTTDRRVTKINATGDLVWSKTFNYSPTTFRNLEITSDDEIYVNGTSSSSGSEPARVVLVKMTTTGSVVWERAVRTSSGTSVSANGLHVDKYKNLHIQGNVANSTVSPALGFFTAKLPSDGSGTGTYGDLIYEAWSNGFADYASITTTTNVLPSSQSPIQGTLFTSSGTTAASTERSLSSYSVSPSSIPNRYVGGLFSNAVWGTTYYGAGPFFFLATAKPLAGEPLALIFTRFSSYATTPLAKGVYATISNPQNYSLAVPSTVDSRTMRPFLFKTDSGALMLGVFAYYNGASSASNVAALMVFSVGAITSADSITLTYLQRIDLSDGGTGFVTSVTPVDDTQRTWVINYGDKAKVYTWSLASNFTLTNTYSWGRSGQVDSYGIDSRGRLWYTTGDVLSYIPLKTDPATANTGLKAYFDSSAYTFAGSVINSNLYVSAYALDGGREERSVTITLEGGATTFADGTTTKTVTTIGSGDLAVPIKVLGTGIFQAKLS